MPQQGEGSRGGKIIGRTKSGAPIYESQRKLNVKALAVTGAGFAASLGSARIGKAVSKFTKIKKLGTVARYASLFSGEVAAAAGADAVIEDLHLPHEDEIKLLSFGIFGAASQGFKPGHMKRLGKYGAETFKTISKTGLRGRLRRT